MKDGNSEVTKITYANEPNLIPQPKYRIGDEVKVNIKVTCKISGETDIERMFYIANIYREPAPVPHYEYLLVDVMLSRGHYFRAKEDDIDGA